MNEESEIKTARTFRVTIEMSEALLEGIEAARLQLGYKSRSSVINRLLEELILGIPGETEDAPAEDNVPEILG
jgi:metal-responsive CopG/Arc/MetJ family transcriptional regulator